MGKSNDKDRARTIGPLVIAGIGVLIIVGVLSPILCDLVSRPPAVEWCGSEYSYGTSSISCHDPAVTTMSPLENIAWGHSEKAASVRLDLALDLSESGVTGLEAAASFPQVGTVDISHTDVRDLGPLSGHALGMHMFTAEGAPIESLDPLENSTLEYIDVRKTRVVDLAPLTNMRGLEDLNASGTAVSDLAPLQSLGELSRLDLASTKVVDIKPLRKLKALERVNLSHTHVSDFTPLGELLNLEQLRLAGTTISDLSMLKDLTKLGELDIQDTAVTDLSPLYEMSTLQTLNITNTNIDKTQVEAFKEQLPGCTIWGEPI